VPKKRKIINKGGKKGKERKGKERKGKERKGKEEKEKMKNGE